MNNNNIKDVIEAAKAFSKTQSRQKGWYAGDGEFWVKCDEHEAAMQTRLKYIFFINGEETTVYQA